MVAAGGPCATAPAGGGAPGTCRTSAGAKGPAPEVLDPGAWGARGGFGATELGVDAAVRSRVETLAVTGVAAPGPGREAVDDEALIGNVSGGLERWPGDGSTLAAGAAFDSWGPGSLLTNCLIRSTMAGSRLARALTLTSSPHFWIRSRRSGLFKPSSFANSWTRVDKGKSSWIGPQPLCGEFGPRD